MDTVAFFIVMVFIVWVLWPDRSIHRSLGNWVLNAHAAVYEKRFGWPYLHSRFIEYPTYHDFRKRRSLLSGRPGIAATFGARGRGRGLNMWPSVYVSNLHLETDFINQWRIMKKMDNGWLELEAILGGVKKGDYLLLPNNAYDTMRLYVEGIEYVEGERFYATCSIKIAEEYDTRERDLFEQYWESAQDS